MTRTPTIEVQFWNADAGLPGHLDKTILRIENPAPWLASAVQEAEHLKERGTVVADRAFNTRGLTAKFWYIYHRILSRRRHSLIQKALQQITYLVLNADRAVAINVHGDEFRAIQSRQRYRIADRIDTATDLFLSLRTAS